MRDAHLPIQLIGILACPACVDRPKVELEEGGFRCPGCGRIYPVENGIPIMLVDRAAIRTEDKGD